MHDAVLGVSPSRHGDAWFVWCETCARGSTTFHDRSEAIDLKCLHLIDPTANPLHEGPSPERLASWLGEQASARRFGAWL